MRAAAFLVAAAWAPPARAFDVAWNSPWPTYCDDTAAPDFAAFGVRANGNASFNGDVVWTIYCPTSFSTFPHYDQDTSHPVNGGIPQRGNLSLHLDTVRRDVGSLFPNEDFAGYAVIDWEVWFGAGA